METVTDHGHTAPVEQPSVMRRHPVKHEIKGRPVRLAVPAWKNAGHLRGSRRPVSGLSCETSIDRRRVAMIGDSLHTDILGGGAAGMQTVLLTGYGLFASGGADDMIDACGITPDWVVAGF